MICLFQDLEKIEFASLLVYCGFRGFRVSIPISLSDEEQLVNIIHDRTISRVSCGNADAAHQE
jgi:hypothetical protein